MIKYLSNYRLNVSKQVRAEMKSFDKNISGSLNQMTMRDYYETVSS